MNYNIVFSKLEVKISMHITNWQSKELSGIKLFIFIVGARFIKK